VRASIRAGSPAARGGYPAGQLVIDRKDRGNLEMRLRYRDKRFPVRGLDPPGQFGRVLGRMADRDAHFNRAITVSGDHAVEMTKRSPATPPHRAAFAVSRAAASRVQVS